MFRNLFVSVLPCADLITRVSIRSAVIQDRFATYLFAELPSASNVAIARITADRIPASYILPFLFNNLPRFASGTPAALSVVSGPRPGTNGEQRCCEWNSMSFQTA